MPTITHGSTSELRIEESHNVRYAADLHIADNSDAIARTVFPVTAVDALELARTLERALTGEVGPPELGGSLELRFTAYENKTGDICPDDTHRTLYFDIMSDGAYWDGIALSRAGTLRVVRRLRQMAYKHLGLAQ